MKQIIEQCIRDWFVAEADTLKLVSPMVTRYRQGGPLEDAHQRLADALAKDYANVAATKLMSDTSKEHREPFELPHPAVAPTIPAKRGPGRPRKIVAENRP